MPAVLPLESGSSPELLDAATRILRASGLISIPTESFYALAVSAFDHIAVRRVAELKGRPSGKPVLVLIADPSQLASLVAEITPTAAVLMERLWPGPLTLVFSAAPHLPEDLTAGTGTIGVRYIALAKLHPLLRRAGPLTGTSANPADMAAPTTVAEVARYFGDELSLILDGGQTPGGLPSTLVDTRAPARVLRKGIISRQQLTALLATAGLPALEP